jgi:hypothetical protein
MQLELRFPKVGARRALRVWRVIAVVEDGSSPGDCGHSHANDLEAVRCPWTPDPWPEVCDLLVRQVRAA